MSFSSKRTLGLLLLSACAAVGAPQGQSQEARPKEGDKAAAYYHFALGHLYSELAGAYGNRGEYLNRAIENYKLALKADPRATFLSEELSDLYIQAGQLRSAVSEAEEALKKNPDDLTARRILGRIYTRMIGDPSHGRVNDEILKRAVEQYQKIIEKDPKDLETWLVLARLHKVGQNSVESENAYKKALELDPNNEDALTGLAMVYADVGDTKKAAELLQKVSDRSPSPRTLAALAAAYEQMRDYGLAAETLSRALKLSPGGNPEMKRALAQNLMLADRVDESLRVYQELTAEDPKDYQSHLRISQIYRQKRDFAKSREAGQKAKQIDPNNLEVLYNEVNLLEAEGKTAEAIAALRDLLTSTDKKLFTLGEKSNRAALLERLGILLRSAEQVREAVQTFEQMTLLDPSFGGRAAAQIVETYRGAREFAKAEQHAEEAVKEYPEDRTLRMVRANVLADAGKAAQAAAELKKLLDGKGDREIQLSLAQVYEKSKNYPEMAKALDAAEKLSESKEEQEAVQFMRGAMYEKMKNFAASEAAFRKVLELNPANASALNYLGYMFADRNVRLQEAYQMISKALDLDPNNPAYLDSLGWVYFRMGKFDKAEEYLRRALERYSRDATIHDHLGDVYYQQGRLKDAIAQWEKSLKEWESAPAGEQDPAEVAKIHKKVEGARVRLAKETGGPAPKPQ